MNSHRCRSRSWAGIGIVFGLLVGVGVVLGLSVVVGVGE